MVQAREGSASWVRFVGTVVTATVIGLALLWAAIHLVYPDGSIPKLSGYCCEYCENGTACVQAAMADPNAVKATVCADPPHPGTGAALHVPIAPWDTWSNVAYLVIAVLPLVHRRGFGGFAIPFSIAAVVLGFGSGLFHAGGTKLGEHADVFGMFIVFGLLAAVSVLLWLDRLSVVWLVLLTVACLGLQYALRQLAGDVAALGTITLLIVVPMAVVGKRPEDRRRLLWALGLFAIAIAFRQLDATICRALGEHADIQGHAIWHVVSALGIGYVFWTQHELADESAPSDLSSP